MQPAHSSKSSEHTLESLFKAKYPWLLRWALHFAHNDAAAAEDLVQEAFVRVLLLKNAVVDLNDIDPLLYAHLRYAYLTELRRGRKYAFHSMSTAEFDTLSISLRSSSPSDQIEVQNELRKILNFSLWRRRSAKFANIFLLRFFHELTHEEIASICLTSRHAVDAALLRSREEISNYLADPHRIQIAGRGTPPDYHSVSFAMPSYEFASHTTEMIFSSFTGACPDEAKLERCYGALNLRPIEVDQLAHIVCCRRCLEKVSRLSGTTPPASGSPGGSKTLARRHGRPVAVERPEKASLARILANGHRRMREIYGHRPLELVVALNGEIVAVRDISSARSTLKLESRGPENLDLVEVFSQQGVLMALLPVPRLCPQAAPQLNYEIALSGDRSMRINVNFSVDGAVVEVSYIDPHYAIENAELDEAALHDAAAANAVSYDVSGQSAGQFSSVGSGATSPWARIERALQPLFRRSARLLTPALATALVLLVVLWVCIQPRDQHTRASDLLRNTVRSERRSLITFGSGVVHQKVEIRIGAKSMQRELYRDVEGRRLPRQATEDADERDLKLRLTQAGFDWDDPLSATDFDAWRERIVNEHDRIEPAGEGLLRLRTTASSGPVTQETITVRLSDLHAIARTMTLRDRQSVEIAEVSFDLEPWSPSNEKFFLPESTRPRTATPTFPAPLPTSVVSDDKLDLAGLSVLLALQDLQADTERLKVSRSTVGMVVSGIVESEERKLEITGRLRAIPHVDCRISSYGDLSADSSHSSVSQSIVAVSAVSRDSPLDSYCADRKIGRPACRVVAHSILTSSAGLGREEMRLRELQNDYPQSRPLTPTARRLLGELTRIHVDHLAANVLDLEQALHALDPSIQSPEAPPTPTDDLRNLIEASRALTQKLVYASEGTDRDPLDIIRKLADSTQKIHAALPRIEQLTTNLTPR